MGMAYIQSRYKKKRLYVYFRYSNKAYMKPTPYHCMKEGLKGCTCKQCKAAEALALEITRKIETKSFRLTDYFADEQEKLTPVSTSSDVLFSHYIEQWLEEKRSVLSYSTVRSYETIKRRVAPYLNSLRLIDIKPAHIRNIVTQLVKNELAPKTIKNTIFMLSSVFETPKIDGLIPVNPAINIQMPKVIKEEPDPFTLEEIKLILHDIEKHTPEMAAFFAIGFYTGMRTGEILALKWENIDFTRNKIHVKATHTANKIKESTKTGVSRQVDIIALLDYYLNKQKEYTFLQYSYLFLNQYNQPFISQTSIVRYYWKPALQRLGLRYREPYQMRHSFACMMLDSGENIKWIASMLGHADLSMITKRYGNWMTPFEGRAGQRFINMNSDKLKADFKV